MVDSFFSKPSFVGFCECDCYAREKVSEELIGKTETEQIKDLNSIEETEFNDEPSYQFQPKLFRSCFKSELNRILESLEGYTVVDGAYKVEDLDTLLTQLDNKLNSINSMQPSVRVYLDNMIAACISETEIKVKTQVVQEILNLDLSAGVSVTTLLKSRVLKSGLVKQYNEVVEELSEELMLDCCDGDSIKGEYKQQLPYASRAELLEKVKLYLTIPCNYSVPNTEFDLLKFMDLVIPFPRVLFLFASKIATSFPANTINSDCKLRQQLEQITGYRFPENFGRVQSVGKLYLYLLSSIIPSGYTLNRYIPPEHSRRNPDIRNTILEKKMPWQYKTIGDFCFLQIENNLYVLNSEVNRNYFEYCSQQLGKLGPKYYSMVTHQLIDEGADESFFNGFTSWRIDFQVLKQNLPQAYCDIFYSHITRITHSQMKKIMLTDYGKKLLNDKFPLVIRW